MFFQIQPNVFSNSFGQKVHFIRMKVLFHSNEKVRAFECFFGHFQEPNLII